MSAAASPVEYGAYGQPIAGWPPGPTPEWVDTRTFECGQGCLQPTAGDCHDFKQRNGTSSFGGGFSCWCGSTVTAPWCAAAGAATHRSRSLLACSGLPSGSREVRPRRLNAKARPRQRSLGCLPSKADATTDFAAQVRRHGSAQPDSGARGSALPRRQLAWPRVVGAAVPARLLRGEHPLARAAGALRQGQGTAHGAGVGFSERKCGGVRRMHPGALPPPLLPPCPTPSF